MKTNKLRRYGVRLQFTCAAPFVAFYYPPIARSQEIHANTTNRLLVHFQNYVYLLQSHINDPGQTWTHEITGRPSWIFEVDSWSGVVTILESGRLVFVPFQFLETVREIIHFVLELLRDGLRVVGSLAAASCS